MSKLLIQAEKELTKFKEGVYKVSQFSKSLLSELIQTKESEHVDLRKKHEDAEIKVEDIRVLIKPQRTAYADLSDWVERFDLQDTMESKSTLII